MYACNGINVLKTMLNYDAHTRPAMKHEDDKKAAAAVYKTNIFPYMNNLMHINIRMTECTKTYKVRP